MEDLILFVSNFKVNADTSGGLVSSRDDLVTELLQFPNAAHDDQVDAMTMAIHYMKESWHLSHPEDPYWEEQPRKKKVAYWRI